MAVLLVLLHENECYVPRVRLHRYGKVKCLKQRLWESKPWNEFVGLMKRSKFWTVLKVFNLNSSMHKI